MKEEDNNIIVREFSIDRTERTDIVRMPFFDGKHKYKQIKKIYKRRNDRWKLAREEEQIVDFDEVHKNLSSEISVPLIIRRTAVDVGEVKNIFGFFLTKSKIKVNMPNMKLSVVDNLPFLHTFDGDSVFCQPISPTIPNEMYTVTIDQKMKRISIEEATVLVRKGVKIYEENPNASPRDRYRIRTAATGRKF